MKPKETRPEIERSLALHREVAVRLREDPNLLTVAIDRVDREILFARLASTPISAEGRDRIHAFILRDFGN